MAADDRRRATVLGVEIPPTREGRSHPGREPSSPPGRPPPSRPRESFWHRIPATWKALTLIAAFVGAGATTQAYFASYVTQTELEVEMAGLVAQVAKLQDQVRQLREADVARSRDLESIKDLSAETRADVQRLLQYMLANPPERRRSR